MNWIEKKSLRGESGKILSFLKKVFCVVIVFESSNCPYRKLLFHDVYLYMACTSLLLCELFQMACYLIDEVTS
jgi:hypothetical protein